MRLSWTGHVDNDDSPSTGLFKKALNWLSEIGNPIYVACWFLFLFVFKLDKGTWKQTKKIFIYDRKQLCFLFSSSEKCFNAPQTIWEHVKVFTLLHEQVHERLCPHSWEDPWHWFQYKLSKKKNRNKKNMGLHTRYLVPVCSNYGFVHGWGGLRWERFLFNASMNISYVALHEV